MSAEIIAYHESMHRVKAFVALHEYLESLVTNALDLSDMLRASHVMAVSSVDFYIHEIVRRAALEIYIGSRPPVPGYQKLHVGLGNFSNQDNISDAKANVEADLRGQLSYLSFQHPDKIANAVRYVSDAKIWEDVATSISLKPKEVKDRLKLIVDRRNKIAHEADVNPTFGGDLWPIARNDVVEVVTFLDLVVTAIDSIIDPV